MSQLSPLTPARHRARAMAQSGDRAGAVALLEHAISLGRVNLGEDHRDVLAAGLDLARVYVSDGNPSSARRVLEEAYAAGQWRLGDSDPLMLEISYQLGLVAEELGNRHEARKAFGRVVEHGPSALGVVHWTVTKARQYLAEQAAAEQAAPAEERAPEPYSPRFTRSEPGPAPDEARTLSLPAQAPEPPREARMPEPGQPTPDPDRTRTAGPPRTVQIPTTALDPDRTQTADPPPAAQTPTPALDPDRTQTAGPPPPAQTPTPPLDPDRTRTSGLPPAAHRLEPPREAWTPGQAEPIPEPFETPAPQSAVWTPPDPAPRGAHPQHETRARPEFRQATPVQAEPAPARPPGPGPDPQGLQQNPPPPVRRVPGRNTPPLPDHRAWPGDEPTVQQPLVQPHQPPPPLWPVPADPPISPAPQREAASYQRNGPVLFAAIAASLAAIIAVVALVFVLADRDGPGPDTDVPTLGGGPPPADVRLRDFGSRIQVSWSDPGEGKTSFIVTGGHPGEVLRPMGEVGPGVTRYDLHGLNDQLDYCFAVVAVYGTDRFASSPQSCTSRVPAPLSTD